MQEAPVLKVQNLTTRFYSGHGTVAAVDGVSFEVAKGEVLGLVGESGSGKSVTAMSILRLVSAPGRIEAGTVELNGIDLLGLNEEEIRQKRGTEIGMVFQNPMTALNPVFTIGWQIGEALKAHNRGDQNSEAIGKALAEVGMSDPLRQAASFPHEMSGGMRQRVVIAMGMINEPQLLIADEPTTALDVTIQAQVLNLMKKLTQDHDTALLLITHNMGVIAKMCDRVAVMYAGEIVEEAPVNDLFTASKHPYTQGLLRSTPKADQPRGKMPTLSGSPPDMSQPLVGCRFQNRCVFRQDRCSAHPDLLQVGPRHLSRCWIAQSGEPFDAHMLSNEPQAKSAEAASNGS